MAVERFVDLPEEYAEAPSWVFAALREVDSQAEVIGISPGVWWVGAVKPLSGRCENGREMLKRMAKDGWEKNDIARWPLIRNALLESQGFGIVGKYRMGGGEENWGPMIHEFQKADKLYRQYEDADPEIQAQFNGVLESDRNANIARKVSEALQYDKRYMFKKLKAGVSVPVGS